MNIAIILAAGASTRFGSPLPKQFAPLSGIPIFEWSATAFLNHSQIDLVVLVYSRDHLELISKSKLSRHERVILVEGGSTRNESTYKALQSIRHLTVEKILVHDAARPFVSEDIITRNLLALDTYIATDTCVPPTDTIIQKRLESNLLDFIPDRSRLMRGQTPQGFKTSAIYRAYDEWAASGMPPHSDDCSVLLSNLPDSNIEVVNGSEHNFKITSSIDILQAEALLQHGHVNPIFGMPSRRPLKRVLIIGGTEGIGRAISNQLETETTEVILLSRRTGHDIRNTAKIVEFIRDLVKTAPIDAIVISAGVLHLGELTNMTDENIDDIISVNFLAIAKLLRHVDQFFGASGGSVLLFSSSSFSYGRPGTAVYSATKAAIANITQALAQEWVAKSIRVNCIIPRRANTPMRRQWFPNEDVSTNLDANQVANEAIRILTSSLTGQLVHVR